MQKTKSRDYQNGFYAGYMRCLNDTGTYIGDSEVEIAFITAIAAAEKAERKEEDDE